MEMIYLVLLKPGLIKMLMTVNLRYQAIIFLGETGKKGVEAYLCTLKTTLLVNIE
jgi:hypothetical protein